MKKVMILMTAFAFILSASIVNAKAELVQGDWSVIGSHPVEFMCGGGQYNHTMVISAQDENGNFTGTGSYDANSAYTWDVTGKVSGDAITFTLVYTGANLGYTLNTVGTIAEDGSITGTTDGNCQTYSIQAGSVGKETAKNHGQYVKSQENKKVAAQSRIGMPVQSKGHTK